MASETNAPESSSTTNVDELRQTPISQVPANYKWKHENGRRYASDEMGGYFLPNDDPEIEALNTQHWIFAQAKDGKMFNPPMTPDQSGFKVLDVGCGSGIWCMEMAEAFPSCHLVGVDISPIQPKEKPSNVEWILQKVEDGLPFPENHFDFIRLSLLNGIFADFGSILQSILRHLKPGGYVEQQERNVGTTFIVDANDNEIPLSSQVDDLRPFLRWSRLMAEAGDKRGRSLALGPTLTDLFSSAGLQNVTETIYNLPFGTWPTDEKQKRIAYYSALNNEKRMDGLTTAMFTKALGWSLEDTQAFIEEVKKDVWDDSMRKYMPLYLVYGQKKQQ